MAKRNAKLDVQPVSSVAPIDEVKDLTQDHPAAEPYASEITEDAADPGLTVEPLAEKRTRAARRAIKPPAVDLDAEKATSGAKKAAIEAELASDSVLTVDPALEAPPPAAQEITQLPDIEPVVGKATSGAKKAAKGKEKAVKMKRLTLDIPKPLHKAIKAQAVEEGILVVDMLRTLLEQHYGK